MLSPYIVAQKSTENYFHKYFTDSLLKNVRDRIINSWSLPKVTKSTVLSYHRIFKIQLRLSLCEIHMQTMDFFLLL